MENAIQKIITGTFLLVLLMFVLEFYNAPDVLLDVLSEYGMYIVVMSGITSMFSSVLSEFDFLDVGVKVFGISLPAYYILAVILKHLTVL
jgi:hypothetical protein